MANPMINPQQHYLKTQIETATQPQLLLMLFDAAVKKLHLARKAMQSRSIEKAHQELTKVQKIFTELMVALDFEVGGELANQLFRIYEYIYHRLVQANIKQDASIIDEVQPLVENLREGWVKAVEIYEQENGAPVTPRVEKAAASIPAVTPSATPAVPPTAPLKRAATYAARTPVSAPATEAPRQRLNIRG